MHQVVCATTNPAKIQAILQAFHEIFGEGSCHIASVAVESGVPEQPFGSEETRAGARNRVANARRLLPEADFWVAIEAGIDGDSTFSWVVIENASQRGEARSATLPLPAVILEKRHIDSLTEEEENWRRQLVNGTVDGRIPEGESMQELSDRVNAALESCRDLPQGSRPLLVSHGIALGCLVSTILGLPAWAERRLRLRNCSISRVDYQESLWLASGWVVETAGDISHLDAPALDELQR